MKLHTRSFDGQFWIYLFIGQSVRITLWRSHLFHRRGRRRTLLRAVVGIIFDLMVLVVIVVVCFVAGALLAYLVGPIVLDFLKGLQ